MKGTYIVFEGISGTGKETQAKLLKTWLSKRQITAHIEYHPTLYAKELLSLWRTKRHIDYVAEAYILLADRYTRITQIVKPALDKGDWVISLRSYISALVYQANTEKDCRDFQSKFLKFEPKPDYLFYFSLSPRKALARIVSRHHDTGEAIGKFENLPALSEKLSRYTHVLRSIPHIALDSTKTIDELHTSIRSSIRVPF